MSEESEKDVAKSGSKLHIFGILGILLFAGGAILSGFVIKQQPQVLGLSAQTEVTSLIAQIGKLIVLPANEYPTATTINDLSKLKDKPFFKNAKKGDKLLVYTSSKWAVLYRPTENIIIETGPFDINQTSATTPTPSPSPSPSPSPTPSVSPSPSPSPTITPTIAPVVSPAAH